MKLDFFNVGCLINKKAETVSIFPEFLVRRNQDILVRGGKFYAVIDPKTGFWRTDERIIQEYVDEELDEKLKEVKANPKCNGFSFYVKSMMQYRSKSWTEYKNYVSSLPDSYRQLDDRLCFADQKVTRDDYISKQLPYPLKEGSYEAWDKLVGTLYEPEEREKIEWAIGSIVSGDSKDIQKFVVFYGHPGAGKGTILTIIQKLFQGYYEVFDAKSLSNNSNVFAFEQFRSNPLVAIQMDGDLSRIEDNTKINSLVSHETVVMNEKRKQSYNFTPHCFLFMASNKPVQITDAKSGLLRRLIDINPSGNIIPRREYDRLMSQIEFELSGIAWHCLKVYQKLGKNYFNGYNPKDMMERTNVFYNFMEDYYDVFAETDETKGGVQASDAFGWWKDFCLACGYEYKYMPMAKFKDELKEYFENYDPRPYIDGRQVRNWYSGFKKKKFTDGRKGQKEVVHQGQTLALVLDQKKSLLDDLLADCQAQYGEPDGMGGSKPIKAWKFCDTTLKNLDTKKLHFVRLPKNHIVIDFDLKNEKGEKDALKNLEAADQWPKTYAEYSQGGKGIHLHYIYDGDPAELESTYAKDIEIKVYTGLGSLRRRLSLCNNIPVARLGGSGLPKKEVKDTVDFESLENEKHLRNIIAKCLKKEIAQPYTAPAMSLIKKTLDDAYASGMKYDIRDLRPAIRAFAAKSSHQKQQCMKMCEELKWFSAHFDDDHKWDGSAADRLITMDPKVVKEAEEKLGLKTREKDFEALKKTADIHVEVPMTKDGKVTVTPELVKTLERIAKSAPMVETVETRPIPQYSSEELVFFDIEVFPNLLLVNWKEAGEGKGIVRMINPTRAEVLELFRRKLVGFNCRRYDNHVLYARSLGYDNQALYNLSQRIISGSKNAMFGPAYNLSYTDVYDFAAKKQSLKKWEIELGIHHQELGLPWDQPVPPERWDEVAKYCDNDVIATEAVFNHLAGDFKAREILADIAGMCVNDTTNMLTTRIIFGDDPKPQTQFNYPDLVKKFPGYRYENGKSYYRHVIKLAYNAAYEVEALQKEYGNRLVKWDQKRGTVTVDEEIGEGGRVYANPGVYFNVVTYDVASMHPSSIIAENGFGKYTERFKQLMDIRVAIKHKDFEAASKMLDGKLAKYLTDKDQAKALSQALKIAINSVYGLTAAGFENKFRDPRNKDNWVAKRGALFMETLRLNVQAIGATVVHIKTDSIKIQNPTQEVTDYILNFGKEWGYTFEVEDIYEKICLVNDAVYIALRDKKDPGWLDECEKAKKNGKPVPTRWTATGAQFQHPYVFKKLFSHEEIGFDDLCETKSVTSALYLDMNENLTDVSMEEKDLEKLNSRVKKLLKELGYSNSYSDWLNEAEKGARHVYIDPPKRLLPAEIEQIEAELLDLNKDAQVLAELIAKGHNYIFIGKAGRFSPVKNGMGGGILCREKDGKFYSATGAKGFRWRESETLLGADRLDMIDMKYFEDLADTAVQTVQEFNSAPFEEFASERVPRFYKTEKLEAGNVLPMTEETVEKLAEAAAKKHGEPDAPPWRPPCGDPHYEFCSECPLFDLEKIPPECKKGYDLSQYFVVNPSELEVHRF